MQRDLTKGGLFSSVAGFSFPFFIAFFLQNFYGLADLFIIGRYNGADVITAVSGGSQVMHLVTVFVVGLSMGTTVVTGNAAGAGDEAGKRKAIGNTVTLFLACSAVLTAALLLASGGIVSLMQTPAESERAMLTYLTICFSGIPFITAYNAAAAVFRGLGDSKTPALMIAAACVMNVVLDFILIGALDMGAAGAALGTIVSQSMSVVLSLLFLYRKDPGIRIGKDDLRPDPAVFPRLVSIGAPIALQEGFIQISFLVITGIANSKGVEVAAAVGIVEKIIMFLFLVPSSMLSTVSAMGAQCVGAGLYERARKTLFACLGIGTAIGAFFIVFFRLFSEEAVGAFTDDRVVIVFGAQYLSCYIFDCVAANAHFCCSGYFSACGLSVWSFIHNALSIVLVRIPGFWLMSRMFPDDLRPWGCVAPLGSVLSCAVCAAIYFYIQKKTVYGGPDRVR